ncbi:MAG: menaquinone biosynthesis protein [Vicinamibacterales bacterium]
MPALRLGAVSYLNARPLTWALDQDPARWSIRYDIPAVCAALLATGDIDLGLVPSIEYLRSPRYRLIPGVGIGSRGAVASVAMYSRVPLDQIRTVGLDTSSRTSVALLRILCRRRWNIDPEFMLHPPDLAAMTTAHDAGLLIGDPALEAQHLALGLTKFDLGEEWMAMTGLPFVYAAWTGPGVGITAADVRALQDAQHSGLAAFDAIAEEYGRGDPATTGRAVAYLRDNMNYGLGVDESAGLQLFLDYAADLGLAPARRALEYF